MRPSLGVSVVDESLGEWRCMVIGFCEFVAEICGVIGMRNECLVLDISAEERHPARWLWEEVLDVLLGEQRNK